MDVSIECHHRRETTVGNPHHELPHGHFGSTVQGWRSGWLAPGKILIYEDDDDESLLVCKRISHVRPWCVALSPSKKNPDPSFSFGGAAKVLHVLAINKTMLMLR